jgi:hypothetical protein
MDGGSVDYAGAIIDHSIVKIKKTPDEGVF